MARKEVPKIISDVGFDFDWSEKKVWALDIPVVDISIKELEWHFGIPFWNKPGGVYDLTPDEVMENPELHKAEYRRIQNADLRHPIDIMENKGRWLILDGLHRLAKARTQGMEIIKVRKIPRSAIPRIAP